MELLKTKKECCGCNTCLIVCPTNAIHMEMDKEGFSYPIIDHQKCINCGLCLDSCAFQQYKELEKNEAFPIVYAMKDKDFESRSNSSSGGIFTVLAKNIIKNNGIVYGAILDDNLNVLHVKTDSFDGLNKMKGSKYVQSQLNDIFKEIKNEIQSRKVLFTGTPCQVDSLKRYLKNRNQENLILCDIICHGVPSPKLWQEHVSLLEKKHDKKIVNYSFRSKVDGWGTHTEVAEFEDGKKEFKSGVSQSFKHLFYTNAALRPACYNCKYTATIRPSDITIADFWGLEKSNPEFIDSMGVSLLIINSSKGLNTIENIKVNTEYMESSIENCMQPNLLHPTKKPECRDDFWDIYYYKGYLSLLRKYSSYGFCYHLKQVIKKIIRRK